MSEIQDSETLVEGFSHCGVCVTDIERSTRFYCEALGFRRGALVHIENEHQALLGISGDMTMHNQFVTLGVMMLELIQFDEPSLVPGPALRAINQLGLTHLSIRVSDIDRVAKKLEAHGGAILHSSRIRLELPGLPAGDLIMCTDPDGTRIELMAWPKEVSFA